MAHRSTQRKKPKVLSLGGVSIGEETKCQGFFLTYILRVRRSISFAHTCAGFVHFPNPKPFHLGPRDLEPPNEL